MNNYCKRDPSTSVGMTMGFGQDNRVVCLGYLCYIDPISI